MRTGELAQAKEFRFALASCQYPHGLFDRKPAGASLSALAKHADDVSLALMVGDQIYADATAGLVDPSREDELYELPHQRAFRQPAMRRVMQRMPVQMLLDDHELFDNWEPLPRGLPPDEDSLRLKRLRKKISSARKHGVAAYLHFQRMLPKKLWPHGPLDFYFEAGGHAFYMLDTRTERQRSRPSEPAAFGSIVGGAQQRQLEAWLLQHRDQVKFIATPSLFLPRRKQSTTPGDGDACRADAWDGFPTSMRWMLAFIEKHELRKIVMLSGDEHHSLHSETWVGAMRIKVVTVHSSALYAPYPFANGRPRDLMGKECNNYGGKTFDVDTFFVPPGDGFAVLDVMGDSTAPLLRIEYAKAGGSGAVSVRVALT